MSESKSFHAKKIAGLRREYRLRELRGASVQTDPVEQFRRWFEEALTAEVPEPNAMTLATATPTGAPSARILLLKDFGPGGFRFYTNYESRKGEELAANPQAALLFFWQELERQVRIEGRVKKSSRADSEAYFHRRPYGSQLGAAASNQSRPIDSRKELEARFQKAEKAFEGSEKVPLPDFWGGYVLQPNQFEFWQGGADRLHDRIRYRWMNDTWQRDRLCP